LPIFNKTYRLAAYKLFFGLIKKLFYPLLGEQIEELRPLMRKSKLFLTVEEYVSTAFLTLLLLFPIIFTILIFFLIFISSLSLTLAIVLSLLISAGVCAGLAVGFFIYPSYRVDNIKRDIELNIPYATTHMATIAGTGVPIYTVFKMVAEFKEYGELANEYGKISRDIEIFGSDVITAISQSAADTPSPHLKELLWGIVAVVRSGGDLRRFLVEKAASFMDAQKNLEKQYLDSLSLLAEMYTTIFVAGPILFVVMITIMGSMGNLGMPTDLIMSVVIYVLMPIASVGFIILIEGSKPVGST
jgi:flagellar protein FlaJ